MILEEMSPELTATLVPENNVFLKETTAFLQELCRDANNLDRDPTALRHAFFEMGMRSLLGLKGPQEWGGTNLPALLFFQFQETIARHCGALAFLQTQHQSAIAKLAHCDNVHLKKQYLQDAAHGKIGVGVGFSQLRRSGSPLVQAEPISEGYQISGQVPWITGYGCFERFILGATLPDGRVLFGLLPLASTGQPNGGQLIVSDPLELAAMSSTNTVTARLDEWVLPTEHVLEVKAGDWIHQSDRRNILNHSFFALGCARAGLDSMAQTASRHDTSPTLTSTWATLDQQLTHCRQQIYHAQAKLQNIAGDGGDQAIAHRLHLRANAIHLAVKCAHGAVIASKGAANVLDHPAQRIYREALAFSVFGQTTAVMEASLIKLTSKS